MLAALTFTLLAQAAAAPTPVSSGYVPQRVYDTGSRAFTDFETMLADLARADVVFVGEQHADSNTHRLELAILEGLDNRQASAIVSLEMFERDVQHLVDRYLASATSETEFLETSRPWPRYASDYRPLLEFAKTQGWPVIAANVPRRHASEVAKAGIAAIEKLSTAERPHAASELECPNDAYFDRFAASIGDHPSPDGATPADHGARTQRYYESQCVKDETMAESIAAALVGRRGPLVHFNGAFHSDFRQGAVERTRRRLPGREIVVLSILPVNDLDNVAPSDEELRRADFLVYTRK